MAATQEQEQDIIIMGGPDFDVAQRKTIDRFVPIFASALSGGRGDVVDYDKLETACKSAKKDDNKKVLMGEARSVLYAVGIKLEPKVTDQLADVLLGMFLKRGTIKNERDPAMRKSYLGQEPHRFARSMVELQIPVNPDQLTQVLNKVWPPLSTKKL